MKKNSILLACCLFFSFFATAQSDYKVVFDLTSKDSMDQAAAIRWVKEVTQAEPTAQVEVVMFGQGTSLAVKGRSFFADEITKLSANKNIAFRVCAVALKNQKIEISQLIPGVQTVPDGIYEVISKQRQGWGYIKVKI